MSVNKIGALRRLHAYRSVLDNLVVARHGRIFNTADDSVTADFASAVECAVAVQQAIADQNASARPKNKCDFASGSMSAT
jgi:class 3 adenylate cyclase